MDEELKALVKVFMVVVLVIAAGAIGFFVANHTRPGPGDGDATCERCVQDCADYGKAQAEQMRRFCSDPEVKCSDEDRRTDAARWKPMYRPGSTGRHAACLCGDGLSAGQSLWAPGWGS
jgi:hypothetical protein